MIIPVSASATYLAFECCGCSSLSSQEAMELESMLPFYSKEEIAEAATTMGNRPLHATVYSCQKCGHTCCEEHFIQGLCYACYLEQ